MKIRKDMKVMKDFEISDSGTDRPYYFGMKYLSLTVFLWSLTKIRIVYFP